MILWIIILTLLFSTGFSNGNVYRQYCANSCVTPKGTFKHTVCERASVKCRPGLGCGSKARPSMTDELRQAILDKHNELRNKIAMGEETTGSQPSASNMNILNYNFLFAQCLANTCDFNHDIHYVYGSCDGNALTAQQEYRRRYPGGTACIQFSDKNPSMQVIDLDLLFLRNDGSIREYLYEKYYTQPRSHRHLPPRRRGIHFNKKGLNLSCQQNKTKIHNRSHGTI